jgi:hypothetical protein
MSVCFLLDENGHYLTALLLSVVIPFFKKNLNFWNKVLLEQIFKNLPIHPCFFVVVIVAGMQFSSVLLNSCGFLAGNTVWKKLKA